MFWAVWVIDNESALVTVAVNSGDRKRFRSFPSHYEMTWRSRLIREVRRCAVAFVN